MRGRSPAHGGAHHPGVVVRIEIEAGSAERQVPPNDRPRRRDGRGTGTAFGSGAVGTDGQASEDDDCQTEEGGAPHRVP